jgi:phage regulator Rha-like protein
MRPLDKDKWATLPSPFASPEVTTMSSREIAELTGKEHFHIKRDITTMLAQLGLDASSFGCMSTDSYNRPLEVFNLPKDLTITLVSGYSVPMRHRIVSRWMELENAMAR